MEEGLYYKFLYKRCTYYIKFEKKFFGNFFSVSYWVRIDNSKNDVFYWKHSGTFYIDEIVDIEEITLLDFGEYIPDNHPDKINYNRKKRIRLLLG